MRPLPSVCVQRHNMGRTVAGGKRLADGGGRKGRQACYDTLKLRRKMHTKTFEEKGLQVSVIDHDAAVAACRPVIDKYCENEDSKAIYDYVMKVREELGIPNN